MKKLLAVAAVVFLTSTSVFAGEVASDSHFYLGVGGGIDVPTQNWDTAYNLGGSAEAVAGYSFDRNIAVQVEVDNHLASATISGVSTTAYSLVPLAELKVSAPIDRFSPYLLAGAGADVQFTSAAGTSVSQTSFDAIGGLGAQINFDHWAIYAEGKYNFIFPNNIPNVTTVQDIPVEAGVLFDL